MQRSGSGYIMIRFRVTFWSSEFDVWSLGFAHIFVQLSALSGQGYGT